MTTDKTTDGGQGKSNFFSRIQKDLATGWQARKQAHALRKENASSHEEADRIESQQPTLVINLGEAILAKGRLDGFGEQADALARLDEQLAEVDRELQELTSRSEAAAAEVERISADLTPGVKEMGEALLSARGARAQAKAGCSSAEKALKTHHRAIQKLEKKLTDAKGKTESPDADLIEQLTAQLASTQQEQGGLDTALSHAKTTSEEADKAEAAAKDALASAEGSLAEALGPHKDVLKEAEQQSPTLHNQGKSLQAARRAVIRQLGEAGMSRTWDDEALAEIARQHAANATRMGELTGASSNRQEQIDALWPALRKMYLWVGAAVGIILIVAVLVTWCAWGGSSEEKDKGGSTDPKGKYSSTDPKGKSSSTDPVEGDRQSIEALAAVESVFQAAAPVESGSEAIDDRPLPELHITAPANALDRPRTFKVTALSDDQSKAILAKIPPGVSVPLKTLRIDAGMEVDDRFHGKVTLAFDLEKLGLTAELYSMAHLLRVDERGRLVRLNTYVQGKELRADIRHNIVLVLGLGTVGGALAQIGVNQYQKTGFASYNSFDLPHFSLHVPKSIRMDFSRIVKLQARLKAIRTSFEANYKAFTPSHSTFGDFVCTRHLQFLRRSDVQAINDELKLVRDPAWLKQHVWPKEVTMVVEALDHAYTYLVKERQFHKPSHVVEIFLRDPWLDSPNILGLTQDRMWTYPYVEINYPAIRLGLTKASQGPTATLATSKVRDELEATIAHELFHVIQKEYYGVSKYVLNPKQGVSWADSNLWFMEATACTLETEVLEDYKTKGWMSSGFDLTMKDAYKGYYKLALADPGTNETTAKEHGYGNGFFTTYLRQRYYRSRSRDFLPTLMQDFGTFCGGPVASLHRITSNSKNTLGMDFLLFAAQNADAIEIQVPPRVLQLTLTPNAPYGSWPLKGDPLSSQCLRLKFSGISPAGAKCGRLILRSNGLLEHSIYTRWRAGGPPNPWATLPHTAFAVDFAKSPKALLGLGVGLQRVEAYVDVPGDLAVKIRRGGGIAMTEAFLLLPPKAPNVTMVGNTLKINWTPTDLKATQDRSGWAPRPIVVFKEYMVCITPPLAAKPLTFRTKETSLEFKLSELSYSPDKAMLDKIRKTLAEHPKAKGRKMKYDDQSMSDAMEMGYIANLMGDGSKIKVTVQDVTTDKPEILGPPSVAAELDPAGHANSVSGVWTGTVPFAGIKYIITISMDGNNIHGTQKQVGERETIPFRGKWDKAQKGWALTLFPDGTKGHGVSMGTYIRRLPGGKLHLSAPPLTLIRSK